MKPTDDEELASAQILANQVRPTTFALAALIFGIAAVSAFWLLVIAGLATLWSLVVALMVSVSGVISLSFASAKLRFDAHGKKKRGP
jgi:uncharacterized oligopeptide transporter (OPT) family protein